MKKNTLGKTGNTGSETRHSKLETRNAGHETGNWKPETLKGQATETLVIIGLVLIVALVAIDYLYSQYSGVLDSKNSPDTESKTYWATLAPLSIKSFSVSGNTVKLGISNSDNSTIKLTDISIDGKSVFSTPTEMPAGSEQTLSITLDKSCIAGSLVSYEKVVMTYTKGNVNNLKETGEKPLVGTCS